MEKAPCKGDSSRPPIPLILVAGFLGAGKTTLIRNLLPLLRKRGVSAAVVINDYRNARIDAQGLQGLAEEVYPIHGTCVCCDSREELLETLKTIPMPPHGALLLEANGTSDVAELAEILTADRRARRFSLPVPVVVVDTKRWQKRYWHNALEQAQVKTAVHLVLTRTSEVSESRLATVIMELDGIAPRAAVTDLVSLADQIAEMVRHADQLPPRRFAPPQIGGTPPPPRHHAHVHHFASMELPLPSRLQRDQLVAFLNELPAEVLRAKGVAVLDESPPRAVLFQKVEGSEAPAFLELPSLDRYETVMVLIGPRCPRDHILALAEFHLGISSAGHQD